MADRDQELEALTGLQNLQLQETDESAKDEEIRKLKDELRSLKVQLEEHESSSHKFVQCSRKERKAASADGQDGVPPHFICPITHNVMMEPMVDREGNTYEKDAILDWFSRHNTSPLTRTKLFEHPLTREELLKHHLFPNRALQEMINAHPTNTDEEMRKLKVKLEGSLKVQLEETKKKLDESEKTNKRMAEESEELRDSHASLELDNDELEEENDKQKKKIRRLQAKLRQAEMLEEENDKQKKRLRATWRLVVKLENELAGAGVQLPDDCYVGFEPLRADDFVEDFMEQFGLSEAEAISLARKEVQAYNRRERRFHLIAEGII